MAGNCNIQDSAEVLAESFVNGNREYVCNQLQNSTVYSRSESVALAAAIALTLTGEYQLDFAGFLEHWA